MEPIFKNNEGKRCDVDPAWSPEQVLAQDGIFYLKDLVKLLSLDRNLLQQLYRNEIRSGLNPWNTLGLRLVFGQYLVNMSVFSTYYQAHLVPCWQEVNRDWDGNELLAQKGVFLLTEVCKNIPFSDRQIRYQCRKNADHREVMGVWRDSSARYLVDMAVFSVWIKQMVKQFSGKTLLENRPKGPKKKPS